MRPRSILGPGVACTLVLLAPSAQSQPAFFPRVNLTGWPGQTDESDPHYVFTPLWTGEDRFNVIVQVNVSTLTPADTAQAVFGEILALADSSIKATGHDPGAPRRRLL